MDQFGRHTKQRWWQFTFLQLNFVLTLCCVAFACAHYVGVYPTLALTPFLLVVGTAALWEFTGVQVSVRVEWLVMGLFYVSLICPFVSGLIFIMNH